MFSVEEHRAAVVRLVAPLPARSFPVAEADGLVLAEEVRAGSDLPRWDNSAMDGYAVREADVRSAGPAAPVRLRVLADLPAGSPAVPEVVPGTAARIMTGAPLPPGADAVVPVEATDAGTTTVGIHAPAAPGAHVRRAGGDVRAGALVLEPGMLLGPTRIAAAVAAGRDELLAVPRPRVAVLATGSELVPAGRADLARGQIHDSNSPLLAAAVRAAGGEARVLGAVGDDPVALRALLAEIDGAVDLVVTSGGVSMGAWDVVKEALAGRGVDFVTVAMQPGKPQGLGRLPGGTPLLALPGNPVSAFVSFEMFVAPAIARLRGLPAATRPTEEAVVAEGWRLPVGRDQVMPVEVLEPAAGDPRPRVRPAGPGGSGSHLVASLARASGLALVTGRGAEVGPGDTVSLMRVDR